MRPCDCRDSRDTKKLDTQGIKRNNDGIEVTGGHVILTYRACTLQVDKYYMKMIAEWYLEDQDERSD